MAVYHSSTDPIPLSLRVNVASAEGLLALTKRGSNSYCTVVCPRALLLSYPGWP